MGDYIFIEMEKERKIERERELFVCDREWGGGGVLLSVSWLGKEPVITQPSCGCDWLNSR